VSNGRGRNKRAFNQLAVETFMPMIVEAFHDGLREVASLSGCLLATLVVINGAAVIALLPLKLVAGAKVAVAGAFLIGILAALGAGLRSVYAFKRVSVAAGTMLGYWLTVVDEGPRLAALEATMKRHMDQAIGSRGTHCFVFVSVAAFLLGYASVGWGMLSPGPFK